MRSRSASEGFTTADLRSKHPELVAERERDKWRFLPPGGESYALLLERVKAWVATVDRPTFAVSHGGVGRVINRTDAGGLWWLANRTRSDRYGVDLASAASGIRR